MAVTATITNLVQEDAGIRIFWSYSDGKEGNNLFTYGTTKPEVVGHIHMLLVEINSRDAIFAQATALLSGLVVT